MDIRSRRATNDFRPSAWTRLPSDASCHQAYEAGSLMVRNATVTRVGASLFSEI
jgi:hypothetical protein